MTIDIALTIVGSVAVFVVCAFLAFTGYLACVAWAQEYARQIEHENGDGPEPCHAGSDGDCVWVNCPQERDGEPDKTNRSCPLANWSDGEA